MSSRSKKKESILIVDDNKGVLKAAQLFLKRHFNLVDSIHDPILIPEYIRKKSYDIILLDMNFTKDASSGKEGFYWLEKILELDPTVVVILMTAYGDIKTAIKAIKFGAGNFILKPWDNDEFLATIHSSLGIRNNKLEIAKLKDTQKELNDQISERYKNIIGHSNGLTKIFKLIDQVAKTDANILILGENGTGKELIARAIHRNSKRHYQPFINVDLGSLTESLFESELFGHVKGAFTDAKEDRLGRFEKASKGTLFLDEIGNLSLPLQSKLLTALQNRKINRVGSSKEIPIDIRLICATNLDLYEMVSGNSFRQDLLYRINTIEIVIPPLRERLEDIPLLADHFLKIYSEKYEKPITGFYSEAIKYLQSHLWPGNIRELQHAIERSVILCNQDYISKEHFNLNLQKKEDKNLEQTIDLSLEEHEHEIIKNTLLKYDGNISKAAKDLGLTRQSLYRRLKKHGL
ncbi:sigma-54-dependent transcriptional regulator [Aquimarina intermedia]|uniref:DNA-binding NtrC family response regulator n=1 Tax=Aquimarina intermedia TaxID=350814 RepID=A0A5S5C5C7_9FLAO|nr:sigma-54 dependent transcriptional regulator [Aquimarina intermedia]TYP74339.1 DNA-binding NtrC family response regulator [Aquimarina intermedia]